VGNERQQWQNGLAVALEPTEKITGSGQNLTAESLKLIAWLHRADRSGPSDTDGNQTCGVISCVMIHKEQLCGGEQVPLTTRRARKGS
jgi:hypothetical protein